MYFCISGSQLRASPASNYPFSQFHADAGAHHGTIEQNAHWRSILICILIRMSQIMENLSVKLHRTESFQKNKILTNVYFIDPMKDMNHKFDWTSEYLILVSISFWCIIQRTGSFYLVLLGYLMNKLCLV